MRRVANATKPVPRNRSRNLDIAKRNFSGELTVTVPVNEEWEGYLTRPNGLTNYTDVRTKSVIGMMAESDIMKKLGACFDDVKIVDAHMCIDMSKVPHSIYTCSNTPRHYIFSIYHETLSAQHPVFTTQPVGYITDFATEMSVPVCFDDKDDCNDFIDSILGEDGTWVFGQGNMLYYPAFDIEGPTVIGAATRRVIPDGFFQSPSYTGNNFGYTEPSWNELASYGSFIFQSKMPGTGVHLSLDVKGTSNSERMMTYPTEMLWNPTKISPQQQAGRFVPFVIYGVNVANLGESPFDASNYYMVSKDSLIFNEEGTRNYPYNVLVRRGIYSNTAVINPEVHPVYDMLNGYTVVVDYIDNYSFNYTNGFALYSQDEERVKLNNQGEVDAIVHAEASKNSLQYCLSVQGYISVRLKHLRTHSLYLINTYPRIGFYSSTSFSCPYTWLIKDNISSDPTNNPSLYPQIDGNTRLYIAIYENKTDTTFNDKLDQLLTNCNNKGFTYFIGVCYIIPSSVPVTGVSCTKVFSTSGNTTLNKTDFTTASNDQTTSIYRWYQVVNGIWNDAGNNKYLVIFALNQDIGTGTTDIEWYSMLSQDSTCDFDDQILFQHKIDEIHTRDVYGWIDKTGIINNCFVSSSYSV